MRRTFLVSALGLAAITVSLFGCGAQSGADASTDSKKQELKKTKSGGATGNGSVCAWDGVVSYDVQTGQTTTAPGASFPVGETVPGPEGCDCVCTTEGISCEPGCAVEGSPPSGGGSSPPGAGSGGVSPPSGGGGSSPPGAGGKCTYHGRQWNIGPMPSLDNCNSCSCTAQGIACTEMACAYTCPAEKVIDCMPMVSDKNLAKCYGPYSEWIAKNCGVTFAM